MRFCVGYTLNFPKTLNTDIHARAHTHIYEQAFYVYIYIKGCTVLNHISLHTVGRSYHKLCSEVCVYQLCFTTLSLSANMLYIFLIMPSHIQDQIHFFNTWKKNDTQMYHLYRSNPSTTAVDSRKAWQYRRLHIQFYKLLMISWTGPTHPHQR
jgi:hypothetical protein